MTARNWLVRKQATFKGTNYSAATIRRARQRPPAGPPELVLIACSAFRRLERPFKRLENPYSD